MDSFPISRRLVVEFLGTALLLAVVVGSGIMGERLAGGNVALALLGNTISTGAALAVLILIFGPISGCHINPAVTFAFLLRREILKGDAVAYILVQVAGAIAGVALAHVMFGMEAFTPSETARSGVGQWTGELVATFGLVATILGCLRFRPDAVPFAVGLFITSGYWFTSSTSFANPAVTLGRALTDSFSGIMPGHVGPFLIAQIAGASAAVMLFRWLLSASPAAAETTVKPLPSEETRGS